MNVKFHLSQDKIDPSIVTNVFQNINQLEATVVEADLDVVEDLDLVVEVEEDLVVEMIEGEADLMTEGLGKCTQQLVEIVEMSVRSHLNQKMVDQFIVTNASQITEIREEIKEEILYF